MKWILLLLLWAVPALAQQAPAAAQGPIAVLPFKNLTGSQEHEWLRVGIPETLISDLRAASTAVVERDQVDRALAELALQQTKVADASHAATVGRMVGARTVVLGAYQLAGKQLRITARFVQVETGLVDQTAKVTGGLGQIFELQDVIVARLLGRPQKVKLRARKKKPDTRAYRLYALSLMTRSDADRVDYLRQALEIDPDFTYATEALSALQARLGEYQERSLAEGKREGALQLASIRDVTQPAAERAQRAVVLMSNLAVDRRFAALLQVSREIAELDLPGTGGPMGTTEFAHHSTFLALHLLKRPHEALQAGEAYLRRYVRGVFRTAVQSQMRAIASSLERQARMREQLQAALGEIERRRLAVQERAERQGREVTAQERLAPDFHECQLRFNHLDYEGALQTCAAFVAAWGTLPDPQSLVAGARWTRTRSLVELGRFDEARAQAERIVADDPGWAEQIGVRQVAMTWPLE